MDAELFINAVSKSAEKNLFLRHFFCFYRKLNHDFLALKSTLVPLVAVKLLVCKETSCRTSPFNLLLCSLPSNINKFSSKKLIMLFPIAGRISVRNNSIHVLLVCSDYTDGNISRDANLLIDRLRRQQP